MLMRHWLSHPEILFVLAVLPGLAVLASADARRRKRVLASVGAFPSIVLARRWPQSIRGFCLLLGLIALAVGAAGPRWGQDLTQPSAPGRDLVVVLDCSKSMFAEQPSRFERARDGLLDLAATFRKIGGHRVALVMFAARAELLCPLTHDYDHFRDVVKELDPELFDSEIGVEENSVSGTRIGLGIVEALRACDERFKAATDILLLSDGDDPAHDQEWQFGIDLARKSEIPIYVVGIGDQTKASAIPSDVRSPNGDGAEIRTQLDERVLRAIAKGTGGTYFAARDKSFDLGSLYRNAIASKPQRDLSDDNLPTLRDRSPWFFEAGLGLLTGSILLGGINLNRRRRSS
jgi:Ca-activated chloride channel family protein